MERIRKLELQSSGRDRIAKGRELYFDLGARVRTRAGELKLKIKGQKACD